MKKTNVLALALVFLNLFIAMPSFAALDSLKKMPIQEGGRVKPFDSFSREMLEIVYGKTKYEGRVAAEIVFTWLLSPEAWKDKAIFEIRNHDVLKALGLPNTERYFKGDDVFGKAEFQKIMVSLQEKREAKEKLNPYFQAVARLENQFVIFQKIASGEMIRVVPNKEGDALRALSDLSESEQSHFSNVTLKFVEYIGAVTNKSNVEAKSAEFDASIVQFNDWARSQNPANYDQETQKINAEVSYNDTHPFRWSYVFYFLAASFILLGWVLHKESFMKFTWTFLAVGFLIHCYGFALRCYIMGRPPVTNMYETVIWVSFGAIVFSTILELVYKFRIILFAGSLVGLFGLVIADFAPAILDPTLQPLEPVLRSNYWLTIHVMTITISYAAFFLAFGLGDLGLYYFYKGASDNDAKIKAVVTSIYRSMQIGVLFLAPGIILGGIWADYSWGRFWGWDPKETWALIALLGYLAVLHARYGGLIKQFGMVVTAIASFSLVIMAWYGVNFVLGAGLHSYGFGAGGIEYVSAFIGLHALAVVAVALKRRKPAAT